MNVASAIFCAAFVALRVSAAQFAEMDTRFEVTRWTNREDLGLRLKSTQTYSVHCVAGTNLWLIEYQPRTNTTESIWFLNGKILRLITYVRDPAADDSSYLYSRRGSRTASIIPTPEGYPGGDLLVNLPWFAFCSGPFLERSPRGVPVPTSPPGRAAFGFTNETTFFADSFRLPRRAAFHAAPGQLKCLYEVQQSTNVLGWNFPTLLSVTHNEPDRFGQWAPELSVTARVLSIRPAPDFVMPAELLELLEQREPSPLRRRQGSPRSLE